jgi:hypothetical protein
MCFPAEGDSWRIEMCWKYNVLNKKWYIEIFVHYIGYYFTDNYLQFFVLKGLVVFKAEQYDEYPSH